MKNLMKYEMRKTLAAKLILLGVTVAAEALYLAGLYLVDQQNRNVLLVSILLLVALAFGGVMVIGLQSLVTLHRDMNTKQSYMLFMTPNSCYRILGAKVLENGLSILLTGGIFFALGTLDITLLFAKEGTLQNLWNMFEQLIHSINEKVQINAEGIACFMFSMLTGWIAAVTAAYLADVISSALLNGKKFNGLLTFVLFLVLMIAIGWAQNAAAAGIKDYNTGFLVQGAVALGASALMYVGTAQIMEKKLSV